MDEATPHLHIDFVPFTTGSKRGLDTRVSLKQALAAQGFSGGSRQETEWNQWVSSEKKQLAAVMERHGIEWEQLGTTDKHLSVLDYRKEQRSKEVAALETTIVSQRQEVGALTKQKQAVQSEVAAADKQRVAIEKRLVKVERQENLVNMNVRRYDEEPEWHLPEPQPMMTAKAYKQKIVEPFITKLKDVIRSVVVQYLNLKSTVKDLHQALLRSQERVSTLSARLDATNDENSKLRETACDYGRIRTVLGHEQTEAILQKAKESLNRPKVIARRKIEYER
jgi:septal ring factor EnvC (AmiA/AmiB activator)